MQSAFVDIGLERDAFLYVTDFLEMEDQEDTDEVERASAQGDTVRSQPQTAAPAGAGQRPGGRDDRGGERGDRNGGGREQRPRRDGRDGRDQRDSREGRGEPKITQADVSSPTPYVLPSDASTLNVTAMPSESPALPASVAGAISDQDESDEQGARRWRGRRRRRGGRGRDEVPTSGAADNPTGQEQTEEGESAPFELEAAASHQGGTTTHQGSVPMFAVQPETEMPRAEGRARERKPAEASAASTPFVLPGESLSKYGASAPAVREPSKLVLTSLPPDESDPLPPRTVTRPSTLVEDEIIWDGKGLLPGESLARHRQSEAAPVESKSAVVDAEPSGVLAPIQSAGYIGETEKNAEAPTAGRFEFTEELLPETAETSHAEFEELVEELFDEEETVGDFSDEELIGEEEEDSYPLSEAEAAATEYEGEPVSHHSSSEEAASDPEHAVGPSHSLADHAHNDRHHDGQGDEPRDGSASHNVDPLPPSTFRLSSLFGGRKKEEESHPEPAAAAEPAKSVPSVSAYSPGAGLMEEEVIEEEEYEFTPLKTHHSEEHDLEEIEEETLQQQIRSGALGEMLQEAHLDHRIQRGSVDEEESDPDEDEEEAAPAQAGRDGVATPETRPGGRERSGDRNRDRGRGRGGRGPGGSSGSGGGDGRRGPSRRSAQTSDLPIISDLLKPGQEILVQIAKEPIAKKGARITSHIALPGRFLVFMPTVSHVGVSRKIASDDERQRLKRILVSEKGDASGGFIVRTAAEGATEEELRADLRFLIQPVERHQAARRTPRSRRL